MKSRDHGKKWSVPCPQIAHRAFVTQPILPCVRRWKSILSSPSKFALWLHRGPWQVILLCDSGWPQMGWKGNVRGRDVWDADRQGFQPPREDAARSLRIPGRDAEMLKCIPPSGSEVFKAYGKRGEACIGKTGCFLKESKYSTNGLLHYYHGLSHCGNVYCFPPFPG